MAFRLGDMVICGELINATKNSTHGWLGLRGCERPVLLQLTGNCVPDLAGRHIRFTARGEVFDEVAEPTETDLAQLDRLKQSKFRWQQIGPTGTMTLRKVRHADCSVEELHMRCKLGEPPPMDWKTCLYLEWFGQNGRVVVELVAPTIKYVSDDAASTQSDPAGDGPVLDDKAGEDTASGPGITSIRRDERGNIEIRDMSPQVEDFEAAPDSDDDPYALIPDDLRRQLDQQARETDRAVRDDAEEDSEVIRELELMDDLIESRDGEPLAGLFDDVLKLPKPDDLNEQQAEGALKVLLARLALQGIALHICKHYTAAGAYRLLVERICREENAYAELKNTAWTQHFDTAEYCPECEAEFDRKWADRPMPDPPA